MYQLIAFDMDGTLLGSDKQISPGNRRAITAAARAGKTVILNTGRCLSELEEYLGPVSYTHLDVYKRQGVHPGRV